MEEKQLKHNENIDDENKRLNNDIQKLNIDKQI